MSIICVLDMDVYAVVQSQSRVLLLALETARTSPHIQKREAELNSRW